MAGNPFINLALPATATAALAVVSYLWYKKTSADHPDECKPLTFPVSASNATNRAPYTPPPEPDDPSPKTTKTPESSLCESPPLVTDLDTTNVAEDNHRDEGISDSKLDPEYKSGHFVSELTGDLSDISSSYLVTSEIKSQKELDNETAEVEAAELCCAEVDEGMRVPMTPEKEVQTVLSNKQETGSGEGKAEIKMEMVESKMEAIHLSSLSSITSPSSESTLVEDVKVEPCCSKETNLQEKESLQENEARDGRNDAVSQNGELSSIPNGSEFNADKTLNLQLEEIDYGMEYYDGGLAPVVETVEAPRSSYAQVAGRHVTSAFDSANHSPSEEMLESPCVSNYSDIHSEESSDSGKGGSDIHVPTLKSSLATPEVDVVYEFELPQDLCGLLIGQHGNTIKFIKNKSQANVYLKRHHYNSRFKLCIVSGSKSDVDTALVMIRNKFPISKYPVVTLAQVNTPSPAYNTFSLPDTMQLFLPEGIMCDVILSSLVTAGHFFVQQPTHPTYPALSQLYSKMMRCYSKPGCPAIPSSVQPSSICAAPVLGGWYRAQVEGVINKTECGIKYLDYGGYSKVPISSLRQIRGDFLVTPFQASECYLANVKPLNEEIGWSIEAHQLFEELAQGQFLQAQVIGYADNGIPFVHLFRIQGVLTVFINRELVNRGVAVWYDHEV